MTTNDKGNELERMVEAHLGGEGWKTYRVSRRPIKRADGSWFSPNVDVGGGDILAWRAGERIRVIQVTASTGIKDRADAFAAAGWPDEHCRKEIWQWQGIAAGLGATREEWLRARCFRLYLSDDGFALDRSRLVWPGGEPPAPTARQGKMGRWPKAPSPAAHAGAGAGRHAESPAVVAGAQRKEPVEPAGAGHVAKGGAA